ncbi:hydrogenase expression/formation C-terminal domain-containing protein, partial [Aquitalea magnusonii]
MTIPRRWHVSAALEITRIPEVALASTDDLADSLDRLQEAW